ncbi:MAG: tRNA (N6-isopentenyl adenosine(37)-C2)-methylthiotransferase MiaB [Candidatus Nealsonbacteria bacterium]|nr:tRNA (N6-isopentenyl adenosine(37)-C2)-methylthiotransferase MiaB [Candidatus Nealsonbacteria bacterium]
MKKYYKIVTYGCAMNRSDSERLAATLENLNFRPAVKNQVPDLLVFNACSVRQSAIDRIYGQAGNIRELKNKNPKLKVVVTGCVLPKDRRGFAAIFDLLLDIRDLRGLPRRLQNLERSKVSVPRQEGIDYFKIEPRPQSKFSALVPISFGCDRFCTYCAVPYTRGLEIDRAAKDILKEVKKLVERGYREITLLGQTVSSWRDPQKPSYRFLNLLREIEKMPGQFWLRFASPYVLDFDEKLIIFLARARKVSRYLNLPLQSGDDAILKRMNRRYSVTEYLAVLNRAEKEIPDFSFSTDIIIGFCGETEKQFQNTYRIFARIRPTMAFIAQYSPRPGTLAQKLMKDDVPAKVKKARFEKLTRLLRKTARENLLKEVGRTLEVLVDAWSARKKECLGKTRNYKTVRFRSQKSLVGGFVNVKILKAREFELEGKLV